MAPEPPATARRLFGDRLDLAAAYAEWLVSAGVERGLIGPREAPRLWDRHLLNSGVVEEALPHGVRVADIGSGAGLPGLVLAIVRPDLELTLVEPLLRRTVFLDEVVADLGLANVEVVRARAEEVTSRRFDVTVSRAVAPLPRLAGWCLPLTRLGGAMVAMKGSRARAEVDDVPADEWADSGAAAPEILHCGAGVVDPQVTLVRVVRDRDSRVRLGGGSDPVPDRSRRRSRRRPRRSPS